MHMSGAPDIGRGVGRGQPRDETETLCLRVLFPVANINVTCVNKVI